MNNLLDQNRSSMGPIELALQKCRQIDEVIVEPGALQRVPGLLRTHFNSTNVFMVADQNTMEAAGNELEGILRGAGFGVAKRVFPGSPRLKADVAVAETFLGELQESSGVPLAVGSGVVNDLVKYCAYKAGVSYLCAATAASMDGYASMGSPLSLNGFKHTIACAPPRVIVADLDIVRKAPKEMTAWGYGDLAGKIPAGGDWLIADALGIEPLDDHAWPLISRNLRGWLSDPAGAARGDASSIGDLFNGLVMAGIAMELHQSSRPASGADHQVAHMWEMDGLKHEGEPVSHGSCVALGCLTVLALYEWLLAQDLTRLEPERILSRRKGLAELEAEAKRRFPAEAVAQRVLTEIRHKYADDQTLLQRIGLIREVWPGLRLRLGDYLIPFAEMRTRLQSAGAVTDPAMVGVDSGYHRETLIASRLIRRRYTILDLLEEIGLFDQAVDWVFTNPDYWY